MQTKTWVSYEVFNPTDGQRADVEGHFQAVIKQLNLLGTQVSFYETSEGDAGKQLFSILKNIEIEFITPPQPKEDTPLLVDERTSVVNKVANHSQRTADVTHQYHEASVASFITINYFTDEKKVSLLVVENRHDGSQQISAIPKEEATSQILEHAV